MFRYNVRVLKLTFRPNQKDKIHSSYLDKVHAKIIETKREDRLTLDTNTSQTSDMLLKKVKCI